MKTILKMAALLLMMAAPIMAGGSCAGEGGIGTPVKAVRDGQFLVYTVYCTSDVSGVIDTANAFTVEPGYFEQARFVAGTAGDAPTDLYDVTILDDANIDFLGGGGTDLRASGGDLRNPPSTGIVLAAVNRQFRIVAANVGNTKKFQVNIFVRIATR